MSMSAGAPRGKSRSCLLAVAALLCSDGSGSAQPAGTTIESRLQAGFDCVLKPSREVHVSTAVPGVIRSIAVDRGSIVKAGDEIAELAAEVETASLNIALMRSRSTAKIDSAASRVAFLSRKRERNVVLNASKTISAGSFDEIETDLALAKQALEDAKAEQVLAELELEKARAVLGQRTIRSPIGGIVTERKLSPGEYWNEQQWIVTIADIGQLNVESFVPIAAHGRIKVGDTATIQPEAPFGAQRLAVVDTIDRVYDAASNTFGIRLKLANTDLEIPGGIRCRISFSSP